jgi:hypothetical protein
MIGAYERRHSGARPQAANPESMKTEAVCVDSGFGLAGRPGMTIIFRAAVRFMIAAGLAGCNAPHPYVDSADEKSVQIDYYGDVAATWPLARQQCARYALVPRLRFTGDGMAVFDCVASPG